MSFDIKFDYRFDDLGFFTSEKKAVLEAAGQLWSTYIQDEFNDVTIPNEIEVPIASVEDADGDFYLESTNKTTIIDEPIDDLLVFAYSTEMPEGVSTLANAGPFGSYVIGSDLDERYNGEDFQPWLGRILFNHNADFYFDDTPLTDDVPNGESDFFSVALHEIGHILGIGASPAFRSSIDEDNMFEGESSMALNGGEPVALHEDLQHVDEDHDVHEEDALLEPTATEGEKTLISDLDLALLSDIGYEINTSAATAAEYRAIDTLENDDFDNEFPEDSSDPLEAEFLDDPTAYIGEIRDYDGNKFDGVEAWKTIGSVDIQGNGNIEHIFVNPAIGRWATVGVNRYERIDFDNYGLNGDTRVVGIYIDPLIELGEVEKGSDFDSQQRFQNDLAIDNLSLIEGNDYDKDGLQEVYFKVNDGSAVLHAYMHADGNIQYANYQSKSDLEQFMSANNVGNEIWEDWL